MNKLLVQIGLLLFSNLAMVTVVIADPSIVKVSYVCPKIVGDDQYTLRNSGSQVFGYGTETVQGNPSFNQPFFVLTLSWQDQYPAELATAKYASSGVGYDPTTGIVTCRYTSAAAFEPIGVAYRMMNGNGGVIAQQTVNTISIDLPVGFAKQG